MNPTVRSPRRMVLVSSALAGGGAERTMLTMAELWGREGHMVTIVTLRADGVGPEYVLPAGVSLHRLRLIGERNSIWHPGQILRLLALRRSLRALRPSVVISFIDKLNVAVLLALWGTKIPVVATEHLAPWMNPLGRGWEILRRFSYRHAAAVVAPTPAITDWFVQRIKGRFETLPYPARTTGTGAIEGAARENLIMGVGRLVPQKGFDLLIEAFACVAPKWPAWNLEILGEGPERAALERQVERLGVGSRVRLVGHVSDVAERLSQAAVFALSSRHEAYPMALCEAMVAGCCVVAADCPTGPREILTLVDEEVGLLVPVGDTRAMAEVLDRTMANPAFREKLGRAARQCAPRFGPGPVMAQWNRFLETLPVKSA